MNRAAGDPKGDHPPQSFAIHFPSSLTPPFIFRFTWGAGQRGGGGEQERGEEERGQEKREMPTFFGQLRSHLSPLLPPRRRPPLQKPSRSLCTERQRRASVAFPSRRRRRAPSSLSLKPPVPGAAGPARPSPHAPQTLSNPLGSRRLLREETLAAAGARAARLRAARRRRRRRRGARYGEPSNEARAGAQRRRVLAEHGRGAAAAVAAAAGAQGPLHHWQPWSPSIFLPRGRRLGSAHVLGGGRGRRRPSLPAGRAGRALEQRCVRASPSSSSSAAGSSSARRRCCSCCCSRGRAEGGPQAVAAATTAPFLGGVGGQTGLVQRLQPTPFKGTRELEKNFWEKVE